MIYEPIDEFKEKQEHLSTQNEFIIDYFDDYFDEKNGEMITNASTEINDTIHYITQNNKQTLSKTFN